MNRLIITSLIIFLFSFSCNKQNKAEKKLSKKIQKTDNIKKTTFLLHPLWEKEMMNFVVAAKDSVSDLYTITFKGYSRSLRAAKQSLLDISSGTLKWQKSRSMYNFKKKSIESLSFSFRPDRILYTSKYGYIYPLSLKNGSAGKRIKAKSGFLDLGNRLLIGDTPPYFMDINSGKKTYLPFLEPKFKGDNVKLAKSFSLHKSGNTALFRTTDGLLRAISISKEKALWKYEDPNARRKYINFTPSTKGIILVPSIYPGKINTTTLKWNKNGTEHILNIKGTVRRRRKPLVYGDLVSLFISSPQKVLFLVTINLNSGKLLYMNEFSTDYCSISEGIIGCKERKTFKAFDQSTGKLIFVKKFPKSIRFISGMEAKFALQLRDNKIIIMDNKNGDKLWNKKIKIKDAPVFLKALLYGKGDKIALLLGTSWRTRPRLNRLYIRIFSLNMPDAIVDVKLGRPDDRSRESRITGEEREIRLKTPVWRTNNLLISAVEGKFKVIDIDKGKIKKSFMLPGKKKSSVSLIDIRKNIFLVERGKYLIAIKDNRKIAWRIKIKYLEHILTGNKNIFYRSADGIRAFNLETGKIVKHPAEDSMMPHLRAVNGDTWYLKTSQGKYVLNNARLTKVKSIPSSYFNIGQVEILKFNKREKAQFKGSWVALNNKTGAKMWKFKFSKHPNEIGGAKSIAQLKPYYGSFSPSKWISADSEGGFYISGVANRCLYRIDAFTGNVLWTRCFHRLGGHPIFIKHHSVMLLPAVAPYSTPGSPVKGTAPAGEGKLSLFSININTGKIKLIYSHPVLSIYLPFKFPAKGNPLVLTLFKEKRRIKTSILKAFNWKF